MGIEKLPYLLVHEKDYFTITYFFLEKCIIVQAFKPPKHGPFHILPNASNFLGYYTMSCEAVSLTAILRISARGSLKKREKLF